jgi:GNAT superfamily N-acetyltransferase
VSEAAPTATLRPEGADDRAFLAELFVASRGPELDLLPIAGDARARLIEQQLAAQRAGYAAKHPEASFEIVVVDGARAGRRIVDRTPERIHLVDIALLPAFRGRGIGTVLIQLLLDEADDAGIPVSLYADRTSPARRLYERLGFTALADDGVRLRLERAPRSARVS